MLITLLVALVVVVALVALVVVRPRLARSAELADAPGVRSALVFRVARTPRLVRVHRGAVDRDDDDDDEDLAVPSPAVLDAICASLEAVGADPSHWTSVGGVLELHGMLGETTFKLTLGALDDGAFLLVAHARTLGRSRWVAPPATQAMRSVLMAVDRGVRSGPGVEGLVWRRRQDDATAEDARPTPFD